MSARVLAPREWLSGSVERVTFHSEETGFCVLRVKARGHRELVAVVGTAAAVSPGEFVECQGEWTNDRNHGLQFRAHELRVVPPSTVEGIEKYLGSGMVKGIGPKLLTHSGALRAVWTAYGQHPCCPQAAHTLGPLAHKLHRLNNDITERMMHYPNPHSECSTNAGTWVFN